MSVLHAWHIEIADGERTPLPTTEAAATALGKLYLTENDEVPEGQLAVHYIDVTGQRRGVWV